MKQPAQPGTGRLPEDARHRLMRAAASYPGGDEENTYRRSAEIEDAIRYAKRHPPQFFNLT